MNSELPAGLPTGEPERGIACYAVSLCDLSAARACHAVDFGLRVPCVTFAEWIRTEVTRGPGRVLGVETARVADLGLRAEASLTWQVD